MIHNNMKKWFVYVKFRGRDNGKIAVISMLICKASSQNNCFGRAEDKGRYESSPIVSEEGYNITNVNISIFLKR